MRITVPAKTLAAALSSAILLVSDKATKRIPVLGCARLAAADDTILISVSNMDMGITVSISAEVVEAGEVAVEAERLLGIAANLPPAAAISIADEDQIAAVTSGRSRYRLPTLPPTDLPIMPFAGETGSVTVARDVAGEMFSQVAFAMSKDGTRIYLNGICLHDIGPDLISIATDGHRLAKLVIPGAAGLGTDKTCIVPLPAVQVINKLLRTHRDAGEVTLRRSPSLIRIAVKGGFTLTSKLIDATFPAYESILDGNLPNSIAVDRDELLAAFKRLQATASDPGVVGLTWSAKEPGLALCDTHDPENAHDVIAASAATGSCRVACTLAHALDLMNALGEGNITLRAASGKEVIQIAADGEPNLLLAQMPYLWPAAEKVRAA